MDMAYQRQAFNELEDHKKKALFANAKLKDELALLGMLRSTNRIYKLCVYVYAFNDFTFEFL